MRTSAIGAIAAILAILAVRVVATTAEVMRCRAAHFEDQSGLIYRICQVATLKQE